MTAAVIFARLVAFVGWPGIIVLGLLGFYEGVPIVNSIPLIGHVPVIGDLALGRVGRVRIAAEEDGAAAENARWTAEQARLEAEYEKQIAAQQYRINGISREAGIDRLAWQRQVDELNQQLLGANDEDYLCSADRPVFSDGLILRLNAVGRDRAGGAGDP